MGSGKGQVKRLKISQTSSNIADKKINEILLGGIEVDYLLLEDLIRNEISIDDQLLLSNLYNHLDSRFRKEVLFPSKKSARHERFIENFISKELSNKLETLRTKYLGDVIMANVISLITLINHEHNTSSPFDNVLSTAHGLAIENIFGGDEGRLAHSITFTAGQSEYMNNKQAWDLYVQSQYNITQSYMSSHNIDKIKSYRYDTRIDLHNNEDNEEIIKNDFLRGPFLSTSIDPEMITEYALGMHLQDDISSRRSESERDKVMNEYSIDHKIINRQDVYGISALGFGSSIEGEIVVLNRNGLFKHAPNKRLIDISN